MKSHSFDVGAFVLALTAIGVAAAFFFGPQDGTMHVAWLAPVEMLALGVAAVASFVRFVRRNDDVASQPQPEQ